MLSKNLIPKSVLLNEKLLEYRAKTEIAVIRALGYKQVGGCADGAADTAPSPARCARGRRSQAHAPTGKQTENKKQGSQKVSQNFLGGGAVTKQIGRVATASRLQSEVYGDEKARRRRGIAAEPLGDCRAAFRRPQLSSTRFYPRLLCSVQTRRAFFHPSATFACKYSNSRLLRIWIYFSVTPRSAAYAFCVFA